MEEELKELLPIMETETVKLVSSKKNSKSKYVPAD